MFKQKKTKLDVICMKAAMPSKAVLYLPPKINVSSH